MHSRLPRSARSASASMWSSCTRRTATCCTSSCRRSATSAAMPTEKTGMKFPLEVARAMREVWPRERALGARISANDWMPGGLGPDDAVTYARELERIGFDYVCVSSGALVPQARIPVAPGYQVPFAEKIKQAARIKVQTVGMIAEPRQARGNPGVWQGRHGRNGARVPGQPALGLARGGKARRRARLSAAVRPQPARPLAGGKARPRGRVREGVGAGTESRTQISIREDRALAIELSPHQDSNMYRYLYSANSQGGPRGAHEPLTTFSWLSTALTPSTLDAI